MYAEANIAAVEQKDNALQTDGTVRVKKCVSHYM